ncbi:MAG: amidohydrolase, partial [Myxococcota bacterium]
MIDVDTALGWRHALHEIAETAFGEHQTAAFVANVLRSLGLDVATGVGGTGVVGTIQRGGRPIGFRA